MCYAAFAAHQKFCLLSFKDAKRKSYRGRIIGFVCDFFAKTVSEEENRKLAAKPKFSLTALFDKSYTSDFDTYYADTFPFRDEFLGLNRKISEILTGTKGSGDIVLVSKQDKDDFAGQDID